MLVCELILRVAPMGYGCRLLAMQLVIGRRETLGLHLMACLDEAAATMVGAERLTLVNVSTCGYRSTAKRLLVPHVCSGNRYVTNQVYLVLFGAHRRIHLDRVELVLTHDSLPHVHSVHVTPIADVSEAEVQIIALKADPVANSLHFHRLFGSYVLLLSLSLMMKRLRRLLLNNSLLVIIDYFTAILSLHEIDRIHNSILLMITGTTILLKCCSSFR